MGSGLRPSRKRTRVTLIAAFRTKQGVAICADSQETVERFDSSGQMYELRQTVQKIAPINVCGYALIPPEWREEPYDGRQVIR